MPSYLFPSTGAYLLCLPPFTFLTTRTGFPALQSLASAPFLSLMGALQFRARALQEKVKSTYLYLPGRTPQNQREDKNLKDCMVNQLLRSNKFKLCYCTQSNTLIQFSTILRVAAYWRCAEPQQWLPKNWKLHLCRYRRSPF